MNYERNITRYITGLSTPDNITAVFNKLNYMFLDSGFVTNPLPPFIPLTESTEKPKEPVTGLLPEIKKEISLTGKLRIEENGKWIIWPAEKEISENLRFFAEKFTEMFIPSAAASADNNYTLLPLNNGLVISGNRNLIQPPPGEDLNTLFDKADKLINIHFNWKKLELVCYKIEYPSDRNWLSAVSWRRLWKRRLKRIPE